jgi:hypothetical protein
MKDDMKLVNSPDGNLEYEQLSTKSLESGLRRLGCTESMIEFTVRAVNSHDALLEAAKEYLADLKKWHPLADKKIEKVQKAIIQAEVRL